jgi:hypothetical protein
MLDTFIAARKMGVPIIIIHTPDQTDTERRLTAALNSQPMVSWTCASGVEALTKAGEKALEKTGMNETTFEFEDALIGAAKLPKDTIMILHNSHRHLISNEPKASAQAVQAVANLRDKFKITNRMAVLLCPSMSVPLELDQDVVVLRDPLPNREQLGEHLLKMYKTAQHSVKDMVIPEDNSKAVEALSGLSMFAAEQVMALSFSKDGLDLGKLWERKRVAIEQTAGLRVHRGTETFNQVVGCSSVKARLRQRLKGRVPVGTVVWLDEIDKVFANVEHDTSGVRMDQLRTLLTEMENNEWEGMILAGLPGGGKSLLGKAFGNEAGVPTIALDLAAMEGSLVGESEQRLRHAIDVIKAVGSGNAYVIATSNNATVMRPELQRRFTGGFFFFDLMTREERSAAWEFYMKRYELPKQKLPSDEGWSAAEIRNCAREAWNSNVSLLDAAQYIVPVSQSRGDDFNEMRKYANGRYLDASKPGPYRYSKEPMETPLRALDFEDMLTGAALATMKGES